MKTSATPAVEHRSTSLLSTPFLFTYAAVASWGVWGYLSKIAANDLTGSGLKVWVFFGQAAAALIIFAAIRFKVQWHRIGATCALLTGFLGSMGDLTLYAGFRAAGPTSILIPLTALAPAVTVVMAVVFLNEKLRKRDVAAVLLALTAGILLST